MMGQTLSHYRILEKIGAGGMGEVYRAHDEQLDRDVALKLLPGSSFADPDARARLLREARTASRLNHPQVCTIYEVGEAEGQVYIAMEWIEGQALSELTPSTGLLVEKVLGYGLQIAEALAHAHERGIVHRDLKSANVVIKPEGRAKVLDFGLAKRLSEKELTEATTQSQVSLTQPGAVVGTLPYMAPEQLRGQPADARSDLWALGVMLYEMTAGHRPFQGQTGFELSSAILNQPPPSLPGKVPVQLRAVIERCLEKEPERRYQRGGEVRAALEAIQTGAVAPWVAWRYWLSRHRALALVATSVALLAVLVGLNVGRVRERLLGVAPPKIQSIAVLPLENLSRDPEQEYFVEGMHEALIAELSKIGALRVISRTSAMRYKHSDKPLPEIARELNVDALIEGSVLREGERVRVTAQLVMARPERHLWANSFDRELRGILVLQSEVARAIAKEIKAELAPQEQARLTTTRPVDPEAYEAYLKGRYYWNKVTEEGLKKGIRYFEQAIEKDPGYALAYAGLADCYTILGGTILGGLAPMEAMPKAKAAALKALEIDSTLAEAHASLAIVTWRYDWDWLASEKEFKRAIELNPGYPTARQWYGWYLYGLGRHDESIAQINEAQKHDPLSVWISSNVGFALYIARQYDRAIEQLGRTLEMEPNFVLGHFFLGLTYEQKALFAEAVSEFQKAVSLSGGSPVYIAATGHAYAVSGKRVEAQSLLDELNKLAKRRYVPAYEIAAIYTGLGKRDQAFAWLEKAYEERAGWMVYLKVDPRLDSLRSDPRFQALLRRMNFRE
jgi:serine/threonine-protein kinase